jgi:hypothetical protein
MWLLVLALATPPWQPVSPRDVVQRFYELVVKSHPLGIPKGLDKQTLWPLMSERLRRHLDLVQACEDDYFRRYRAVLDAGNSKPSIGWLERGLFSGENEMALPAEAVITRVEPKGQAAFRVRLDFTYRETSATNLRPADAANTFHWPGIALVVSEGGRYVVDDVLLFDDSGKPGPALSRDFPWCNGGRWVGPPEGR